MCGSCQRCAQLCIRLAQCRKRPCCVCAGTDQGGEGDYWTLGITPCYCIAFKSSRACSGCSPCSHSAVLARSCGFPVCLYSCLELVFKAQQNTKFYKRLCSRSMAYLHSSKQHKKIWRYKTNCYYRHPGCRRRLSGASPRESLLALRRLLLLY